MYMETSLNHKIIKNRHRIGIYTGQYSNFTLLTLESVYLSGSDVVQGSTGHQPAVWSERHRVDWINGFTEGVKTCTPSSPSITVSPWSNRMLWGQKRTELRERERRSSPHDLVAMHNAKVHEFTLGLHSIPIFLPIPLSLTFLSVSNSPSSS